MFSFRHLLKLARRGLADMLPALRRAFNDNPNDDRLDRVYGANPRLKIVLIALIGIAVGESFARLAANFPLVEHINWPAVITGLVFAIILRRYLFRTKHARAEDFPWLAASLIPVASLLVLASFVGKIYDGDIEFLAEAPAFTRLGGILVAIVDASAVAAALTIASAALCFSRNWFLAVKDLLVQLLVFRIMMAITVLLVIEIGILGPILAAIIDSAFGIRFPEWLSDFVDQLSYVVLLGSIYTAVIGVTWIACRQSFPALLETGHADIIATVKELAKKPKKPKKPKNKKQSKKDKAAEAAADVAEAPDSAER